MPLFRGGKFIKQGEIKKEKRKSEKGGAGVTPVRGFESLEETVWQGAC